METDKRALIIPDCHIPFEDKRAYDLMLLVSQHIKPLDEIVILGDYADFYGINSHGKDPSIDLHLDDEITEVRKRLKQLRILHPKQKIVYLQGNHEYRLERYIQSKAPDLYGILSCPELFYLDNLNIDFVEYGPDQKYSILGSKLLAKHEPIAGGVHCAHGTVTKASCSVIFGHTHRIQESQIVSINGECYRGISSGWLGDKSSKVMSYVKNHHQWSLAFSVMTLLSEGVWFNQIVHIIEKNGKYHCIFEGHKYEN